MERILLIDDDVQDLEFLKTTLHRCGYAVVTASSGIKAMNLLRDDAGFDLAILEIARPAPDGFAILRFVRKTNPNLKVLAISGFMDGILLQTARQLGASATLWKSSRTPEELPLVVAKVVGGPEESGTFLET